MFKSHPDNMRMEPTPERVYALCRLILSQSLSKEDVRESLSLGEQSSSNHTEIAAAIAVATDELELLRAKDDLLVLNIPPDTLGSTTAFRRHLNTMVFDRRDSTFFLFSSWYLSQNEDVYAMDSWEVRANTARTQVPELAGLTENAALGWRFWASFLGLGYLSGTALIPNMKTRIQDVLASRFLDQHPFGEPVAAQVFLDWAAVAMPEVDPARPLSMGFSAGLRTLHELSVIELEMRRDTDKTALYYVDGDAFNAFSHITVKEAVYR